MILDDKIVTDIEISVNKKQQQEYKKLGEYTPSIDGYAIFEYNRETKSLNPATFRQSDVYVIGGTNRPILETSPNCVYVEALNEKNAIKRLRRGDIFFKS